MNVKDVVSEALCIVSKYADAEERNGEEVYVISEDAMLLLLMDVISVTINNVKEVLNAAKKEVINA